MFNLQGKFRPGSTVVIAVLSPIMFISDGWNILNRMRFSVCQNFGLNPIGKGSNGRLGGQKALPIKSRARVVQRTSSTFIK